MWIVGGEENRQGQQDAVSATSPVVSRVTLGERVEKVGALALCMSGSDNTNLHHISMKTKIYACFNPPKHEKSTKCRRPNWHEEE